MLAATEQFILQQCNCESRSARGLSKALFARFPYANVYKTRHARGELSTPGTISAPGDGSGLQRGESGARSGGAVEAEAAEVSAAEPLLRC